MTTFILFVLVLLFFLSFLKVQSNLNKQYIVSELTQSRRNLMQLVHEDKIKVDSEMFSFLYTSLEVLIRIRYFNKTSLLPSSISLAKILPSKNESADQNKLNDEIEELVKDKEVEQYLKTVTVAIRSGIVKNKTLFIGALFARYGILLSILSYLRLNRKILEMAIFLAELNNQVEDLDQSLCKA